MSDNKLTIEIFSAPGCNKCRKAFKLVESVLAEMGNISTDLRLVNVVDELDYAVDLGVRATPGIAMNGVLVFTAMPSVNDLRDTITAHLAIDHQESK